MTIIVSTIILIAPQMGENIGAAARAMKNFGISDLRIVAPRDGWPNTQADNMSVFAIDIIKNAQIYNDIKSALDDLEWIYATSANARDMNKEVIVVNAPSFSQNINAIHENGYDKKIGIMFGRENSGLTNEEISYANQILAIATHEKSGSLNIAHAVAVICYEFSKLSYNNHSNLSAQNLEQELAKHGDMTYFYEQLFNLLEQNNFFRVGLKQGHVRQKIKNIFSRIPNLTKSELQILHGVVNSYSKREFRIRNLDE